jgi:hypothetical protein
MLALGGRDTEPTVEAVPAVGNELDWRAVGGRHPRGISEVRRPGHARRRNLSSLLIKSESPPQDAEQHEQQFSMNTCYASGVGPPI